MTERERWIVYPLLFLALGASLRDKLAKQTRSQQIVCQELFIVNDRGEPVARLAEGSLMLEGTDNSPGMLTVGVIQTNSIQTQNLQAQNIVQRGKPVGDVVSWGRLLQFFQQLGLIHVTPTQTVPGVPALPPATLLPVRPSPAMPAIESPSESGAPVETPESSKDRKVEAKVENSDVPTQPNPSEGPATTETTQSP